VSKKLGIIEIDGFKYSKSPFEDYTFSSRVALVTSDRETTVDVYTTDPSMESLAVVLRDRSSNNVESMRMLTWTTRAQDDAARKFIEEELGLMDNSWPRKGCKHLMGKCDHNDDHEIYYCNHKDNTDDHEGNCNEKLCPLNKAID